MLYFSHKKVCNCYKRLYYNEMQRTRLGFSEADRNMASPTESAIWIRKSWCYFSQSLSRVVVWTKWTVPSREHLGADRSNLNLHSRFGRRPVRSCPRYGHKRGNVSLTKERTHFNAGGTAGFLLNTKPRPGIGIFRDGVLFISCPEDKQPNG